MKVILSLGSNHDAEVNIMMAEKRLGSLFSAIIFSRKLITKPIGMPEGTPPFANAIGIGDTQIPLPALQIMLKALEKSQGRMHSPSQKNLIPLDIDVLQYGETRYKTSDWQRSYNKLLIGEILSAY